MVFGLGRKAKKEEASAPDGSLTTAESPEDVEAGSGVRANGPFDESEISSRDGEIVPENGSAQGAVALGGGR